MWNPPTKIQLSKLPKLYETEDVPFKDKVVHMHYWIGETDWYMVEYDGEDLFYGYTILNGDMQNAEWGYISLQELKELKKKWLEVDRELRWKKKKASDVPKIVDSGGAF
jgi:hypothetical protein